MTPAEVLRKAAEYLEEKGWARGYVGEHGGRRCVYGAIGSVCNNWLRHIESAEAAYRKVSDSVGYRFLEDWNDQPGRTAEEVIAKLREVADKLDEEAAK